MRLFKVKFPNGNYEEFDDIEAARRFAEQYPGAQLTSPDPDKAMQKIIEAHERSKYSGQRPKAGRNSVE